MTKEIEGNRASTFDPEKVFFQLPVVIITFWIYIVFVSINVIVIALNGDYGVCGKGECFNFMLKQFTFPLGLLSSSIPVFAIFATQHRSAQTLKQISESQRANNFSIYYQHYEKFFEGLDSKIENSSSKNDLDGEKYVANKRKFHKKLFLQIKNGQDHIIKDTQKIINEKALSIYKTLIDIQELDDIEIRNGKVISSKLNTKVGHLINVFFSIAQSFELNIGVRASYYLDENDITVEKLTKLMAEISSFYIFFNTAIEMCHEYMPLLCQREGFTNLSCELLENKKLNLNIKNYAANGNTIVVNVDSAIQSSEVFCPEIKIGDQ
jgi:hypothetical protein